MKPPSRAHILAATLLGLVGQATAAAATDDCDAAPETWQPRSAVSALAERNGWQVERLKIDDGCYELRGRDAGGHRIKAKIHPATLQIVKVKRGRHERERDREGGSP